MKIAYYLYDQGVQDIDFSHPEDGNPGIGGTEYCYALVLKYLCVYYPEIELVCYHVNNNRMPNHCQDIIVKDEYECVERSVKDGIDLLVYVTGRSKEFYHKLDEYHVNALAWVHCFFTNDEIRWITDCNEVKRVVFVGREQYDTYMDHDIIKKSSYIYNMNHSDVILEQRNTNYHRKVVYVGSITKIKGFHILAKIWKNIVKEVPDAELIVIGSGKLYSRNNKLGKYGIAEEQYENEFMKYLIDDEGHIIDSVHFMGIVGEEKSHVFKDAAVGIINPTAVSETFGISAVEMEEYGIPIVTRNKYGLLDTVIHKKTGLLFRNNKQFTRYLIELLTNQSLNNEYGKNAKEYVLQAFPPGKISAQWNQMFLDIQKQVSPVYINHSRHIFNNYKFLRIINRKLRFSLGLRKLIPVCEWKYRVKKIGKRIIWFK